MLIGMICAYKPLSGPAVICPQLAVGDVLACAEAILLQFTVVADDPVPDVPDACTA